MSAETRRGVLVTCDPTMRQFLLHLDKNNTLSSSSFILSKLDDTHLFVDSDIVPTLKQKVEEMLESIAPDIVEKVQ